MTRRFGVSGFGFRLVCVRFGAGFKVSRAHWQRFLFLLWAVIPAAISIPSLAVVVVTVRLLLSVVVVVVVVVGGGGGGGVLFVTTGGGSEVLRL